MKSPEQEMVQVFNLAQAMGAIICKKVQHINNSHCSPVPPSRSHHWKRLTPKFEWLSFLDPQRHSSRLREESMAN